MQNALIEQIVAELKEADKGMAEFILNLIRDIKKRLEES